MHPGGGVASDAAVTHTRSRAFLSLPSSPLLCCAVPSRRGGRGPVSPDTARALSPLGSGAEVAQVWRPLPAPESWPTASWPSGSGQAPHLPPSLGFLDVKFPQDQVAAWLPEAPPMLLVTASALGVGWCNH